MEFRNSVTFSTSIFSKLSDFNPTISWGLFLTPNIRYPPLVLAKAAIVLAYFSLEPQLNVSLNSIEVLSRDIILNDYAFSSEKVTVVECKQA